MAKLLRCKDEHEAMSLNVEVIHPSKRPAQVINRVLYPLTYCLNNRPVDLFMEVK